MVETKLVLALANMFFGIGISVITFCRINALPQGFSVLRTVPYAMLLTGGLASALQPWMDYWPTPQQVFCSAAFFLYIFSTRPRTCEGP